MSATLSRSVLPAARPWWRRVDPGYWVLILVFVLALPALTPRVYAADEIEYFSYLHSLWFDGDVDFTNQYLHFYETDPAKYTQFKRDLLDKREPATGLPLNVAPIGSALLWAPFFAAAHMLTWMANALGAHLVRDGYSPPYLWAVALGSATHGFAGLLLAYSLARRYASRFAALVACLAVWFATPAVFYLYITPPMSHANSLFVMALFLYVWYQTRNRRTLAQWALLGAVGGLMAMTREQDALFFLIPGVELVEAAWRAPRGGKITGLFSPLRGAVAMGVGALLAFTPQLLVYHALNGSFGPSRTVTGKLLWDSPYFLPVLLSPEHGALIWSPVLGLAIVGLVWLWRLDRGLCAGLVLSLLAQIYIMGAFKTWSQAGSFGSRRLVDSSAIFVIGLAVVLGYAGRRLPRPAVLAVVGLLVVWNLGLIVQFSALWTTEQRQALDLPRVVHDQVYVVPRQVASLAHRFLVDRSSFYQKGR